MVDNKSDFVRDPEVIAKEQSKLIEMLYKNLKLDPSTGYIKNDKDLDGRPKIIFKHPGANLTGDILNDEGWKYGVYYLEGSPKTGFRKCVNGKWLFIDTQNDYSKATFMQIKTPYELSMALISVNPSMAGKIQLASDNTIQIIGAINDIELPYTSMHYDANKGMIVDSTNPDYAFKIEFVNAQHADLNSITSDNIAYNNDSPFRGADASMQDFREAGEASDNLAQNADVQVDAINTSIEEMQSVNDKYTLDGDEIKSRFGADGDYHSIGNVNETSYTNTDESVKRTAVLNEKWIEACCIAMGVENTNNDKLDNDKYLEGEFLSILKIIKIELNNQNSSMKSIVQSVVNSENIENKALAGKVAFHYLKILNEKGDISITADMDPTMLPTIINNAENEMEDAPVMEMQFPNPGINTVSNN